MEPIRLPIEPIGVKIFSATPAWVDSLPPYRGVSYCRAVHETPCLGECWLDASSLTVCGWAPVALGMKAATGEFGQSIEPRLEHPIAGVYLTTLSKMRAGVAPDVAIVRGNAETLRRLIDLIGWDCAAWEHVEEERVQKSALRLLREGNRGWRYRLVQPVNQTLFYLKRMPGFAQGIEFVFKSETVTHGFDRLIKRAMADMSICRNSTVIPHLTGLLNASFFCTGGIAWGHNHPSLMTSGWPWALWEQIANEVTW
ncbi:MAG TPA: hypothetical protein PK961_08935 [bacterium]|nr:hypothetical protein [bacterium]